MENQASAPVAMPENNAAPSSSQEVESSPLVENLQNQIQNGSPAQKVEAKKTLRSLKLKVDGKEISEELPFDLEDSPKAKEYLSRELQKSKAFDKRAAEYSQLEKEVRSFIDELRKNPSRVLKDPTIGVDIKKLAAEVIEEEIANSKKSPQQIEKEKLEAELKAMKEEREKEKEDFRQKEFERLQQQEFERYDMLMTKALETTDLPKSPYIVKKMADYMLLGLQEGVDVTPEDVIPLVREEMQNDLKEMFQVMPEEVIEKIVGKDTLNRIRKKNLKRAQGNPPTPLNKSVVDSGNKAIASDDSGKEKKTIKQLWGV